MTPADLARLSILMDYIEAHADEIHVRAAVNGEVGNYALSSLPAKQAIQWAFEWIKRDQKPYIVTANDNNVCSQSIEELEISVRAYNLMHRHNIKTIGELAEIGPIQLLLMKNCGEKTLREIIEVLAAYGLCLREPNAEELRSAEWRRIWERAQATAKNRGG